MDARARTETISRQVSEALAGSGVVVDDVTVQPAGRRRLVRVFLARDVSGLPPEDTTSRVEPLSLDEIAEATRTVSAELDGSEVMGEAPYTLEVSSPGLDRPLLTRDHFRRNVGRLLTVVLAAEGAGTTTGRLAEVRADGIRLIPDGDAAGDGDGLDLPWEGLTRATVQVEFSRPDGKDL
ncbi:ribosome maturation factor RimP [Ornithinimicrobium humiphilum]|uniref:Ribosome maturation factor RimP n=2 Tax=Ornithinimicrobium humiphilum TaxID=125288 RepID=A0A543KQ36_9MICO|nr:ribosome maturation factor RimP [Ornithinimicrobium humiphilum]